MLPAALPVGCQKSAWPVSCSDGPGPAVRHDDHPCPCACFTSSLCGSAAGWSCSAVQRPPKTPSCSCCGTRSPCCAGTIPGPGSTGPTAQSSPHSSGSCRQSCGGTGSSPPAPSCAGRAPAERRPPRRQQPHLRDVLSIGVTATSVTPIAPAQKALIASKGPDGTLFTRWTEAKQLMTPETFSPEVTEGSQSSAGASHP
jgi:hypothetical protein